MTLLSGPRRSAMPAMPETLRKSPNPLRTMKPIAFPLGMIDLLPFFSLIFASSKLFATFYRERYTTARTQVPYWNM
jgi:hypothetical protein